MARFSFLPFGPVRLGVGLLVTGLMGLSVAGCVQLLEPRTADVTYYVLDDSPDGQSPTDPTGLNVGLRKPRLASYLDASRIVTRRGDHELHFSESHRWGEQLERSINRAVALHLEARPGIRFVEVVPWSKGTDFDAVVQLHVRRFEGAGPPPPDPDADDDVPVPEGRSQMTVQWTLFGPDGETRRAEGTTNHEQDGWTVTDYEGLVSRLESSLKILSADIGTRLEALDHE